MATIIFWISTDWNRICIHRLSARPDGVAPIGGRPVRKRSYEPAVSLVIAMGNEAGNVLPKMKNCRDLNYPADKLQVIVSLDAPTDSTYELLRNADAPGLTIVSSPIRTGKAVAVNRGVAAATGEILVFGDASQRLEPDAVRELVANFADESVGAVSGALVLLDEHGQEASDGAGRLLAL